MEKRTDEELIVFVAQKQTPALKVLYRRYEIPIFNFIFRCTGSREIARELIQETFTRIWFASHTFDRKRGSFKSWLYTIALNITRNEMSKKEYAYFFTAVDEARGSGEPGGEDNQTPEAVLHRQELRRTVADALGTLQEHLREVVVMRNYQHLKFREIAEVTGMPESTVKARYHRAIQCLRQTLEPVGQTGGG